MNIMKKMLFLGILGLSLTGCSGFIPREDIYEKVEFVDKGIKKGRNEIKVYSLEYPAEYSEKVEFLKEFETASKKLILQDKRLNLLISSELYGALNKFKDGEFLKEEELYIKLASDLDEFEKNELNQTITKEVTDRGGEIQADLNRQLAFWYETLNRSSEFDGNKIYTELDKQRLMEEVRASRREFFDILNTVNINLMLKVEDPYNNLTSQDEYWETTDIDLFNQSGVAREIQSIELPLYLEGIDDEGISKVIQSRRDFKTQVLILESDKLVGYTVEDKKYTFYHGGDTLRGYYKGYDLRIDIEEVKIDELAEKEAGILIDGILLRNSVEAKGIEEKEMKEKDKSVDWGLN